MPGLQARAGLFTFLRYAGPGWQTLGSFSQSIHRAAYRDIPEGEEEFWIVEGEMRPIRGIQDRSLLKVIEKGSPPSVNANLTKKQVAAVRLKRVLASRLTQSEVQFPMLSRTCLTEFFVFDAFLIPPILFFVG